MRILLAMWVFVIFSIPSFALFSRWMSPSEEFRYRFFSGGGLVNQRSIQVIEITSFEKKESTFADGIETIPFELEAKILDDFLGVETNGILVYRGEGKDGNGDSSG